jgi:hypothetical protein
VLELDEMKINIEINTPQKTSSPKKNYGAQGKFKNK